MKVYILPAKWIWIFVLLLLCNTSKLVAQCNPPDQLPTVECEDAPLICLLNACYETLNIPGGGPSNWCGGSTSIQNPQYFQIIPTAPDVEIHIHVDNCENGTSLQSAILGACPWTVADVLACNPGTPPGGTMILSASGLTPGEVYWLMIDGFSGAFCNYTITFTENILSPGFTDELGTAEAIPSSVCVGYDALMFVADPPIALAHGYFWVLGWSGDTITSTLPTTVIDVPGNLDPGTYEICVYAFSGCDTTDNDLCFDVEVFEIPPEDKEPEIFCPEEFPFSWGSTVITGEGEFEQSFTDAEGCTYDSIWMVNEYPEPELGIVDTIHCLPIGENTFYYENEPYDEGGTYPLFYENGDINGCDSMAELNLVLIGVDAVVELTCENGEYVITAYIQEQIPFNADVEFFWYQGGSQAAEGNPLSVLVAGCYELYITVSTPEGTCEFFIETICFDADDFAPPAPVLSNADTLLCAQAGIEFCVIPDPFGEQGLEYLWTAPSNVTIVQNGLECAIMDFSASSGGQVCVNAIGACGSGLPSCFQVNIIPAPVAAFSFDPTICVDEITTIAFTGSASPNAQVIWDFSTPTTLTGSGLGPYMVSWAGPGNNTVTLTVIEPGCDTAVTTGVINVDLLVPPVINCASTINSILFDWDDVSGASGYFVSLNGGATVPVNTTDTLLMGLSPGTMIELILTVVSGGACPNIIDTIVCTAENCPPPLIELSGQDSACLNAPAIIDLDALVNGSPGTGTWSGAGIIDANAGLFDPVAAGVGQHQVTYLVIENGCPFNQSYTIAVFDSITADFVLDPLICITDVAHLQYNGNGSAGAAYTFNFGAATVEAGTGVGPFLLSWNTPGQKTIRLQVAENGCMSDVITHTTDVVNSLAAPVVPCTPNTSGVVFTWTIDPAATGSAVTVLSGHTGTLNGNTYTFGGLVPGNIVEIEIITMTNGPCPERRDTFACEARACPMPLIAVTQVDDICLYPGTGSVDLDVSVTNGNGIGDWSGPGVTDLVNGTFNPSMAGSGSHLVTYHYLEDGCDFFETITINVYDVPVAYISNTDLIITCASGSIVLDGSGSTGGPMNYSWSTLTGVIQGTTTMDMAEAIAPGLYQLLVTNMISGCSDSVTIAVSQSDDIPTADAGPDKSLTCDSTQFTLGGTSTTGADILYAWSTIGGNITGPINGKTISANRTGSYTIVVRDTLTGCESQDLVVITIDTVVAGITLTPGDTIDCNTVLSSVSTSLNEPMTDYTFSWSTGDGQISGSATGSDISVTQGGTYTLTISNKRNGCAASENVFVPESDEIIDGLQSVYNDITCFGDDDGTITIQAVQGGVPNYTYTWSVSSANGTNLTSLSPGAYTVTVSDANGCMYAQTFSIEEPAQVTLDLGPDQTVAIGDTVNLNANTNLMPGAIASLDWEEYNGNGCPGCPLFQFIAQSSATISAFISDTSGCSIADSVRLTVLVPRIYFIPSIFSPNGDGINDLFSISGRFNLTRIPSLRIYDRWGSLVFERLDFLPGIPELGWDGTSKGEPVQSGVFVFMAELEFEDLTETVTGSITVLR